MIRGKKILIGITGSIAAYKIPYLIRLLRKAEAEVKVIMTPFAGEFITPLTLSTLSGNHCLKDFYNKESGEWNSHVDLGLWADLFVIAPLTANSMAKMAGGIADNLLLATYLSARCPVFFAPAMDIDMYKHPVTQSNIKALQTNGNYLIAPAEGELASGLCGEGRMEEPEKIFKIIEEHFKKKLRLKNKKILITAGPTVEPIDPVRFISNHSSGLMGFSLAREAAARGAEVYLVSGPTSLDIDHPDIYRIDVTTADEMYNACTELFEKADITIMAAAVSDFKPEKLSAVKIKKRDSSGELKLKPTKDILAELGKRKKNNQILVGFALETDNEVENAREKIIQKNLDLVVLNSLKDKGAGFKVTTNKISVIDPTGKIIPFALKSKESVASDILDQVMRIAGEKRIN